MEMVRLAVKLAISLAIITFCTQIGKTSLGKKLPTLAGLIAAMPLTTLIVLVWMYTDNPDDLGKMQSFVKGVFWGIIPTALFFVTAFLCFRKGVPFSITLPVSFSVWILGAIVHQVLLKRWG
jgi:uncharacterized membrane protein (GlpM family)